VKLIIPSLSFSKKFKITSKSDFGRFIPHSRKPKIKSSLFTLSLPSYEVNCLNTLPVERIESTPRLFIISRALLTTIDNCYILFLFLTK